MNAPADRLAIALAQLNPTVGDVTGNAEKVRRARATGEGAGRRTRDLSGAVHRGLSARGPRAEAGVPGGVPLRRRGAGARDRRWRPGCAGRRAVGRREEALQRLSAARRRQDRRRALQGRTAELRRVRREARVRVRVRCRDRSCSRACASGSRSARTSGMPDVVECISETGGEILLVPNGSPYRSRQDRSAPQHRGLARGRERTAARLSQHGRRAGRARVRRRLVRPECRPLDRVPASGVPRDGRHHESGCARTARGAACRPRRR